MIQSDIENLYNNQLEDWPDFKHQVDLLNDVKIRTFDFGNHVIKAQYNPARAVSSNAKLDARSIAERKCFLCPENRPGVQSEVRLNNNFSVLVNPYPILKEHFTIPHIKHQPQEILPFFDDMLDISQLLSGFIVFYNGPKAGASAPDHMHFQAVRKGQLPLESEFEKTACKILSHSSKEKMGQLQNYGRECIRIESCDKSTANSLFSQLYKQLQQLTKTTEEPLMNVFVAYESDRWNVFVFPRKTHRPSCFFAEGTAYKMISPGAIDMAGIFVLPRKEDFDSLTKEIIADVFGQVSLTFTRTYQK